MTSRDTIAPSHRDVSRALSATLATFRGQLDVLPLLASQFTSAGDADRFVEALLVSFAAHVARKTDDPEQYLLGWIAMELQLSDDAEAADNGDADNDFGA